MKIHRLFSIKGRRRTRALQLLDELLNTTGYDIKKPVPWVDLGYWRN